MIAMTLLATRGRATRALLLILAGANVAGQARAQPTTAGRLQLEWNAPPECPSAAEVGATITRLLGGSVAIPTGRHIAVKAIVTPGPTWRVDIQSGAEEQRHRRALESSSCAELAEATALLVALLIDANTVAAAPPPPTSPPTPPPAAAPSPPRSARSRFRLGVLGTAGLGILPGLEAGIGGALALVRGPWRFDLRGSYGLRRDQRVTVASPAGAYGVFNFTGGVAGVCRNVARLRMDLGLCADVELGVLSARGHGFSQELRGSATWLGLGPAGYVAIRAGRRVSFPVRAALLVPITRPEFVIKRAEGVASAHRVAPVSGQLSVGVELHF